ncbi:hypothetical protein EPN29_00790 [bacterium]|nr:MAG: hypothetical protein EPN29_00790 [bacterium]
MRRRPAPTTHQWVFKARFRRGAFGWRSAPAVQRVREAVSEIRSVARKDPILAAEGAIAFLERVSPALESVDSSSGSIGTAVNNAIDKLVPIIAAAPADPRIRSKWLDRLWESHEADQIPYIEQLGEYWGDLCGSKEVASEWADQLIGTTRLALSPDRTVRGFFHGSTACLSALFAAGRYGDILDLLKDETFWPYKRWAVEAMAAMGDVENALELADASRGPWTNDHDVDQICESILLAQGRVDDAYRDYGLRAHRATTFLATLDAVCRAYPDKPRHEVLADLVASTPGEEGKWFAAAKDAGLYDEALALATRSPCDPKTLTRAARDFAKKNPAFALGAGTLAMHWLIEGYGYEITSADVWAAHSRTLEAAGALGRVDEVRAQIRAMVAAEGPGTDGFVTKTIGRELGL